MNAIDHDAPTKEHPALRHVLPPDAGEAEPTELVTLWLPESYLRRVREIQAGTGESIAQVVVRHSANNVATEAYHVRRNAKGQ
jgi:hypothetical protein